MKNKALATEKHSLRSRDKYLQERDLIRHEIGDLEQIRLSLGLSQRRACQLLLVDPSAWTRWNKTEAPPHIYQALRWLLQLKKLNSQVVEPSDLSSRLDFLQINTKEKIAELESNVAMLERGLQLSSMALSQSKLAEHKREMENQRQQFQKKISLLQAKIQKLSPKKKPVKKAKRKLKKKTVLKKRKKPGVKK